MVPDAQHLGWRMGISLRCIWNVACAAAVACVAVLFSPAAADAQQDDYILLRNRGNPSLFVSVESGLPVASIVDPAAFAAQWLLEPVPGEYLVRIRNREQNTYLHSQ